MESRVLRVGGVNTTEHCNLSCVMCEFHGPRGGQQGKEASKVKALGPPQVRKFLAALPPQQTVWFASFGEFFLDPEAIVHLRSAMEYGHEPAVLTNGQLLDEALIGELLDIGVRRFSISVDAIDEDTYRKVRRLGDFGKILTACRLLMEKKQRYPDILLSIGNVVLKGITNEEKFIKFWRGKADTISFFHHVHNFGLNFSSLYYTPTDRNPCVLYAYLLPSGQISPCCTMNVQANYFDIPWLPTIDQHSPEEAMDILEGMYADPDSPLRAICAKCDHWIRFAPPTNGNFPHIRTVSLE